ncbi:hypothetical protein Bca4012_082501 [Brassica carinata]
MTKKRGKEKQKSLQRDRGGEKSLEAIHVPFDLALEILWRLPVKTLARFRCVSKLWSSSIITESIKTRYDSVKKEYLVLSKYLHGFFGYDPVKNQYKVLWFVEGARLCDYPCQVITFRGPNKQKWREIEIQDDISPPRSNGVCINGIICYLGGTLTGSVLVLGRFDVRFERFDHIQMPIDVEMNQLEELSLVNYQGKLGCTFYSKDRAEVWIMKDHLSKKPEWSKVTLAMSPPDMLKTRIAGVTLKGEIVIMPKTLGPSQTLLYADFYDPKENNTRRVEFETTLKGELEVCILSEPDHMENTMSLFGSQFNKKPATPPSLLKKKSGTTTLFSDKKPFPCPKKLLVIAFLCAVLVLATSFRTWLIPLLDPLHQ